MSKFKVSEILNNAINEHLWRGVIDHRDFSQAADIITAVTDACLASQLTYEQEKTTRLFLRKLEFDNPEISYQEFPIGRRRQYARAFALTWVAMLAEEIESGEDVL